MAIVENPHIYNIISETFNAAPEEIDIALKWRQAFLEKRKEYNRKYLDKVKADAALLEASKEKSKEWFQKNKQRAAARQKHDMKLIQNIEVGSWSIGKFIIINGSYNNRPRHDNFFWLCIKSGLYIKRLLL